MKKWICIALILTVLLLAGCGKENNKPEETTDSSSGSTQTLPLDDLETPVPTEETTETTEADSDVVLAVLEVARYAGPYVEDGSDETVENVACILVENTTEQYVDYGVVTATVDGRDCSFTVAGLPGGGAAWVMESGRTPVEEDGAYSYGGETVSPLRDVVTEDERVTLEPGEGYVVVTNVSDSDLTSVRLYYKQLHEDGNYLGGITYTVLVDGIKAGESRTVTAGHFFPGKCAVVRLDVVE